MKKMLLLLFFRSVLLLYSHAQSTPAQTTPTKTKAKKPASTTATTKPTTTSATAKTTTTDKTCSTATAAQQKKTEQQTCAIKQIRMPLKQLLQRYIPRKMVHQISVIKKIR